MIYPYIEKFLVEYGSTVMISVTMTGDVITVEAWHKEFLASLPTLVFRVTDANLDSAMQKLNDALIVIF